MFLKIKQYENTRDISVTGENTLTKGAQTWTPKNKNNAEERKIEFCSQKKFSENNDKKQQGNILA
jgi:hypothetical protein